MYWFAVTEAAQVKLRVLESQVLHHQAQITNKQKYSFRTLLKNISHLNQGM